MLTVQIFTKFSAQADSFSHLLGGETKQGKWCDFPLLSQIKP